MDANQIANISLAVIAIFAVFYTCQKISDKAKDMDIRKPNEKPKPINWGSEREEGKKEKKELDIFKPDGYGSNGYYTGEYDPYYDNRFWED